MDFNQPSKKYHEMECREIEEILTIYSRNTSFRKAERLDGAAWGQQMLNSNSKSGKTESVNRQGCVARHVGEWQ